MILVGVLGSDAVPRIVPMRISRRMRVTVVIVSLLARQMDWRSDEQQQQTHRERGRGSLAAEDHGASLAGASVRSQAKQRFRTRHEDAADPRSTSKVLKGSLVLT